jgi:hypothetical protein
MSVSSMEEACKNFDAFVETHKPRILKCPCGREDEYDHTRVILIPLDYQPATPFS